MNDRFNHSNSSPHFFSRHVAKNNFMTTSEGTSQVKESLHGELEFISHTSFLLQDALDSEMKPQLMVESDKIINVSSEKKDYTLNKFSQLGKLSIDSVNYGNGCFEPYRNKNKDKPPAVSEKANQAHQFSLNHSDNYNRREAFSNEVKDKAPIPMRNNYIR